MLELHECNYLGVIQKGKKAFSRCPKPLSVPVQRLLASGKGHYEFGAENLMRIFQDMKKFAIKKWLQPGGANYESKGGTPLPRVGSRSHGWDPDHKGRTSLPRV